jgi:hypothetical protein
MYLIEGERDVGQDNLDLAYVDDDHHPRNSNDPTLYRGRNEVDSIISKRWPVKTY